MINMNEIASARAAESVNPFDFANPVSSKERFVGREQQCRDAAYYLDHAKNQSCSSGRARSWQNKFA